VRSALRAAAAFVLVLAATGSWAADPAAKPPVAKPAEAGPIWASLSASQQSELAPLQKEWPTLDASRKEKWLVLASRLPRMSATERQRIQARMAEWASLSPTERGRARQNFQEMRIARPEDRQALWDAYQALPAEQRQELAQRAKPASSPLRAATTASEPKVAAGGKRNIVQTPAPATAPRPVSPTVVQAKPGATTTLLSTPASPPPHNQPGLPKIAATDGFVNPSTQLPKRGPQGAAARSAAAPASTPEHQ
jgi:hypothetical protein